MATKSYPNVKNMLKLLLGGNLNTRTVTPVLHQDAIKQLRSTTDGGKSTQEYLEFIKYS